MWFTYKFSFISKPRTVTSRKIKPFHLEYVNMWMSNTSNPELTAQCILQKLEKQCGVQVSKEYVCALRRRLNWSAKHMKYVQLISHKNVRLRCDFSTADKQGHVSKRCLCRRINSGNVLLWTLGFSSTWLKPGSSACKVSKTQAFLQGKCVGRNFL